MGLFEVIVVDDGSADRTAETVEEMKRQCGFKLLYLHHPNRGPGYTQNRGIRAARGELVLLIADDIWLDPDALAGHLDFHRRYPEKEAAALGCVVQSPELRQSVFVSKWDPWRLSQIPDGQVLPYYMFWACHISFKRDFMLTYGMFREELGRAGAAAHEDAELGYRLLGYGLTVTLIRSASAYHHHEETLEGTLKRSYMRGLNWGDFRRLVPRLEVDIAYRVYGLGTLITRYKELTTIQRQYLLAGDRSVFRLGLRWLVRETVFNRWLVAMFWLPLFVQAERRAWVAALVKSGMYRGVVLYYFLRGCRAAGPTDGQLEAARMHRC